MVGFEPDTLLTGGFQMSEEKKELFVGIDLHKRRWHVPVRSETVKPLTSSAIWAEEFKMISTVFSDCHSVDCRQKPSVYGVQSNLLIQLDINAFTYDGYWTERSLFEIIKGS